MRPSKVEDMRVRVQQIVDTHLDEIEPKGRTDIVQDLAYRVPAAVILEMLGIPDEDHKFLTPRVIDVMAVMGRPQHNADPLDTARAADKALLEIMPYMQSLIHDRRQSPTQDMLTSLVSARDDGQKLSDDELLVTSIVMVAGGIETTANYIGNGILALLRNPSALRALRDDPSIATSAAEELLRYDGVAQILPPQLVTETLELGGQTFHSGDMLYPVIGAANRDPARFENPDLLDLRRRDNAHLTFGLGIHFCPGAALGRLEGEVVFTTLAKRFPHLRLDPDTGPALFRPDPVVRGLQTLPVRFDPL
jgi:cytochrome P450